MLPVAGRINNFMFKHPGMGVMDKDRVQSGCECGIDVRLGTVADHPRRVRNQLIFMTYGMISVRIFLTRYFNGSEMVRQPGARKLISLLLFVALCHENQAVP